MGETPTGGHILVKNLNFPQFYSKTWPWTIPTKTWGFFMFPSFFFFFAFVFLLSLCISTSWSLKRYPPGGVSGKYIIVNSVSIALTLTPAIRIWINFLGVNGNCFWNHFLGCKSDQSLSSLAHRTPLFRDYTCTPEITRTHTHTLELFSKSLHLRLHSYLF